MAGKSRHTSCQLVCRQGCQFWEVSNCPQGHPAQEDRMESVVGKVPGEDMPIYDCWGHCLPPPDALGRMEE